MIKRFKIQETNLENLPDTHFTCETQIGGLSTVFEHKFKTIMFDGLFVKVQKDEFYLIGEVHGPQPE